MIALKTVESGFEVQGFRYETMKSEYPLNGTEYRLNPEDHAYLEIQRDGEVVIVDQGEWVIVLPSSGKLAVIPDSDVRAMFVPAEGEVL